MLGNVFGIGIPFFFVVLIVGFLVGLAMVPWMLLRRGRRLGYPSTGAYLRAAPGTDEEKRDAVDLTLRGIVLCVLGMVFPPFVLIGLIPLFYGGRKLVYASMGLGLVDDGDTTRA